MKKTDSKNNAPASPGRRDFFKKTGRFAAATPPAVVFLLSTSLASEAVARSGRGNGKGNGGHGKKDGGWFDWLPRR